MRYTYFAIAVFLTGVFLTGCSPRPGLYSSDPVSLTEGDPALVHGILENGFRYVLLENQTPKDRVSLHLNIFAGSIQETDQEQGLAHYLEHMLFNGSEHFKPGELVQYFQSIGMEFGADANASTSYFRTVYDLNLPKGDRGHLEDGLLVIQDYAGGALLLEDEIERERGIILAEKRERDSVSYRKFKQELEFELPGALLNRRHPIGIDTVIQRADRDVLKSFYDAWYRPDNMVLVAVGDFDIQEMKSLILERFSKVKPRTRSPLEHSPRITWEPHQGIKAFYYHEPEAGDTEIRIERIFYSEFTHQTLERMKEDLIQTLADQMLQNRLSRLIRNRTAGFSSAEAYSGQFLRNVCVSAVNARCQPEIWENCLSQLEMAIRQTLEFGFSQKELDRVKADYISSLESADLQADTRKTEDLSRKILQAINNKELFLSPSQELTLLRPFIDGLTLDRVMGAFKENWVKDHRLILVTGNLKLDVSGDQTVEERIENAYRNAAQKPVIPFQEWESRSFPYLPAPGLDQTEILDPKQIVTEKIADLGITTVDFKNKVRLNLKPTDFQKNRMIFKLVFGPGGQSCPKGKSGLDWIGQTTVQQSGFGSLDMDQLEEALAGRDVGFEFGIEEPYFALTGSADSKESELMFQLIYTFLKDPGFRAKGLDLAKTLYRQMYDNLKKTPDGIMRIQGDRFLAQGDSRFGLQHPDEIDRIRIEDIRAWLLPHIQYAPLELSVVGDFDPTRIIDQAVVYLGTLEPRREIPQKRGDPVIFPKGKKLELNLDTRIDKGVVRMAFPTDDFWNITQTRRLSLLARAFSERLRIKVREDLGASYSPYVYNHPSLVHDGYGVMHVVAPVDPSHSDKIMGVIREIAGQLNREGVTPREVELVRNPVMIHLKDLKETNAYWLNSVMADSTRHPQRMEWARQIVQDYGSITPEELNGLAKKFLHVENAAWILIQPGKN